MAKSSIHFKPVKPSSESHNLRKVKLDYVREDLSKNNEHWVEETISERLARIQDNCKKLSGRKLQTNAEPIREAVLNIQKDTTIEILQLLGKNLENYCGIKAFQIFIHRDEGHLKVNREILLDEENKKLVTDTDENFVINQHAHILFDWSDKRTGKTLKLNRMQMSKIQDIVANTLKMERGTPSSKAHLDAVAYKIKKLEEEKELLIKQNNLLFSTKSQLERERIKRLEKLKELEGKYGKYEKMEEEIMNPLFDAYKKKRETFLDQFAYEEFLYHDTIKIGSFYWLDKLVFVSLADYEVEEFLLKIGLENESVQKFINCNKTNDRFSEENDDIRKEIYLLMQNLDLSELNRKIQQIKWKYKR